MVCRRYSTHIISYVCQELGGRKLTATAVTSTDPSHITLKNKSHPSSITSLALLLLASSSSPPSGISSNIAINVSRMTFLSSQNILEVGVFLDEFRGSAFSFPFDSDLGVNGISIAPCNWRYCSESRTGMNILSTESDVIV